MRFRYTVALYTDSPIEAEIADYLSAMPRARRQEAIRMLMKMGFSKLNGTKDRIELPVPEGAAMPTEKDKEKEEKPDTAIQKRKTLTNRDTTEEKKSPHNSKQVVLESETDVKRHDSSHIDRSTKYETDLHGEIEENTDSDYKENVDPLSKINALFDGINSE